MTFTLYANPLETQPNITRKIMLDAMKRRGARDVAEIGGMTDAETWPEFQETCSGTADAESFAEIVHATHCGDSFYGLPTMSEDSAAANRLQYAVCHYSERLFPDCSINVENYATDMKRLRSLAALLTEWGMLDKAIAVVKPWSPSSFERLPRKYRKRYIELVKRLFPAAYVFMPGRLDWRYASRLPSHVMHAQCRTVFGSAYDGNDKSLLADWTDEMDCDFLEWSKT